MSSNMISERIKSLRSQHGLTVREFAEKAKITHSMVSDYENNRKVPGKKVIKKIAEAFGMNEIELTATQLNLSPDVKSDFIDKLRIAESIEDRYAIEILSRLIVYFKTTEEVNRNLDSIVQKRMGLIESRSR